MLNCWTGHIGHIEEWHCLSTVCISVYSLPHFNDYRAERQAICDPWFKLSIHPLPVLPRQAGKDWKGGKQLVDSVQGAK